MLKPVRAVERPPEQYRTGPTQTGKTTELQGLTREQVIYLCNLAGTALPERSLAPGCYNPKTDQVIVMGEGLWPEGERKRLQEHEWGHARGWRHDGGSLPPKGLGDALNTAGQPTPPERLGTALSRIGR